MNNIKFNTPNNIANTVASNFRNARKASHITMKELSNRSGVPYSSIKRFEYSGQISFVSLIKIASVLNMEDQILKLFPEPVPTNIDQIIKGHL